MRSRYATIANSTVSALRIFIDYRPALRARTGVGEYLHQLVRVPDVWRHDELTLFSSSWKDSLEPSVARFGRVVDRRIPVQVLNLLLHRLGAPAAERLAHGTFDVVFSPHPLLFPSTGGAQVVTVHDVDFVVHPERTRAEVRRDYVPLAYGHARRADLVVVPSRHTAARVGELFGVASERIVVCHHGRPDWPARSAEPAGGYVLSVGTLEPRKNVEGLVAAYDRLRRRRADMPELRLAGHATPEVAGWLTRLAPPLSDRVRPIGYVADTDRPAVYAGASLLVLPSFDEGFGLPALEAMTVGVPVVASARGALPEVLGEAALLIDPADPDALAAAIERVLVDAPLRQALIARGLERARAFSWRESASRLRAAFALAVEAKERRV
jgi:glycosyltransferase involved in cell wall biosynthesis